MRKMSGLAISLVVVLFVLWSCGGGGGGSAPAGTNPTTSGALAGGCAGYDTTTLFSGSCQNYYGIAAATYESGCKSEATSVWYAAGCPATIGSSTRLGACTYPANAEGQYFVVMFYAPENTLENAKTSCAYMSGTWAN